MKKIVLLLLLVMPLMTMAQTKIKETQVPKSVLNALDRKYDSYKVKTWYRSPGQYVAELRGLWKIYNGEAMGGPFVSHTQVDTVLQRVLTTEVFLYASGQKKRNSLRKAEAILYTQHWAKERAE